jgi:hypothetical protein
MTKRENNTEIRAEEMKKPLFFHWKNLAQNIAAGNVIPKLEGRLNNEAEFDL